MKKILALLFVCCAALSCVAENTELIGRINSVQEMDGEDDQGNDLIILKVNTIQSGSTFKGVLRVAVQLEDKKDQIAWGTAQMAHATGEVQGGQYKGASATGAVVWTCKISFPTMKRPKLRGYSVEYGYMENGTFVALDEDFYRTDSFEELKERNKNSILLKPKITYMWYVG